MHGCSKCIDNHIALTMLKFLHESLFSFLKTLFLYGGKNDTIFKTRIIYVMLHDM